MKAEIIQVLASFVGSFGFAVLYNLRGKNFVWLGFLGWYHGSPILSCGMRCQVHLWRIWQRPQLRRFMQKQWQGS